MTGGGYPAWHYDGLTALRRAVTVEMAGVGVADGHFVLVEDGQRSVPRPIAALRRLPDTPRAALFGVADSEGWRLGFDGGVPESLAAVLPAAARYGGWIDRVGLVRASLAFAAVSAAIVGIVATAPQWLAPLVPFAVEQRLGEAMVGDFGGRLCRTPAGSAALARMVAKVDPQGAAADVPVRIDVANIAMVNAITLPGGRIVIFQGLIDQAGSSDELAGVIGHEIGHARHRDVLAALMRQFGLSVALGGLDGNSGGLMNGLLATSYGRAAESSADDYARERLAAANIDPAGTAAFFARVGEVRDVPGKAADKAPRKSAPEQPRGRDWTAYLSTHPASDAREKAFLDARIKGRRYTPALSPADWAALRTMCRKDAKVRKDGFLDLFE